MAAEDYIDFDSLFEREDDDNFYGNFNGYYRRSATVECPHCGVGALRWREEDRGWTLVTAHGLVHKCEDYRVHKAAIDDFDVL